MAASVGSAATKAVSRLPPMLTIGDIIRLYRLRALKHLSQNFLLDQKLIKKIVDVAGPLENCCVLEVGPGPGSLTRGILNSGIRELTVIERDTRFLPVLNELKEACNIPVHVKVGDILRYELQSVFPEDTVTPWLRDELPPLHVIANLPFNISTPLLIRWLSDMSTHSGLFRYGRVQLTLMFQHEVAQRMIAHPGNVQRSRLTIMCENYCKVEYVLPIPGSAFMPKPEVSAGVVHITPLKEPIMKQPFRMIEKVVRNVFNARRKDLTNCVKTLFPPSHPHLAEEILDRSGVPRKRKPFTLDIAEYARICQAYEDIVKETPVIGAYNPR